MKNKPYVITYVLGLVIGALLCIFYNRTNIFTLMVIIIGALIILPSIFGIGKGFAGKKEPDGTRKNFPWYLAVVCILGLIAGILLISFASFFAGYIVYTLGVLLVIAGIVQIMCLVLESHDVGGLKKGWYWMPWITVAAGIVIVLLGPEKIANFVTILTGIVFVLYGLNGLFSVMAHHHAKKRVIRAEEKSEAEAAVAKSEEAAQSETLEAPAAEPTETVEYPEDNNKE